MATRTSQGKIRSPYSGSLFNCPQGCGCPNCAARPARPIVRAIASLLGLTVLVGGACLAGRAVWAVITEHHAEDTAKAVAAFIFVILCALAVPRAEQPPEEEPLP